MLEDSVTSDPRYISPRLVLKQHALNESVHLNEASIGLPFFCLITLRPACIASHALRLFDTRLSVLLVLLHLGSL